MSQQEYDYSYRSQLNAKFTWEKVDEIRNRYEAGGVSQAVLAEEYGVCKSVLGRVVRYWAWKSENDLRRKGRIEEAQ